MAIFGPKAWGNPFEKNVNFSLCENSCFDSSERRFFVLDYCKYIFMAYVAKKKS